MGSSHGGAVIGYVAICDLMALLSGFVTVGEGVNAQRFKFAFFLAFMELATLTLSCHLTADSSRELSVCSALTTGPDAPRQRRGSTSSSVSAHSSSRHRMNDEEVEMEQRANML